jgi:gamma-glutamyltranspeptidase / glutathione hydrolase
MKTKFSIASDSPHTVDACKIISEMGGNAVDIAVAGAMAASFTELLMCSLGGSAFINVKIPGKEAELIDGSDAMPSVADEKLLNSEQFLKNINVAYGDGISINIGHGSVAVPGMLKALETTWKRHGSLAWKDICAPAIAISKKGCPANSTMVKWLRISGEAIFYDHPSSRESFFPDGKNIVEIDEHFQVPYLDQTLEAISREGSDIFYKGDIASLIEKEMLSNGGFLDRKSLANYEAIVRKPLMMQSHGFNLALNPPPAIGGAMLGSMIKMYELLYKEGVSEGEKVDIKAKVQKTMSNLRREVSGEGWSKNLAATILEEEHLKKYLNKPVSPHTLHMSVATEDGSVVSITMSNGYGSGVTVPGTGIAFNNSLGEPELNPKGFFSLKAGERLVSNMCPVVAWNNQGETLAIGSPGASRITTSLFQAWVNYTYDNKCFDEVVDSHRFHVDKIAGEYVLQHEPGIDISKVKNNFKLRSFDTKDMYFGAVNLAGIATDGKLHSCADNRRNGADYSDHR